MLLNIVKLRYLDVPIFVDVGQIVAGCSLETTLTAGDQLSSSNAIQGNTANLGAQGRYTDRPTITYVPMTGGKFMKQMLSPIPPASIFSAMQAGLPADSLLWPGVASINGIRNVHIGANGIESADPRFVRVATLLRAAQISGALGIRIRSSETSPGAGVTAIGNRAAPPEALAGLAELRELLGLRPNAEEYRLDIGDLADDPDELAVQSRSPLGVLQTMALRVDVPAEHVREGRSCRVSRASMWRTRRKSQPMRPSRHFTATGTSSSMIGTCSRSGHLRQSCCCLPWPKPILSQARPCSRFRRIEPRNPGRAPRR